jgi:hypothetical protein
MSLMDHLNVAAHILTPIKEKESIAKTKSAKNIIQDRARHPKKASTTATIASPLIILKILVILEPGEEIRITQNPSNIPNIALNGNM